MDASTPAPGSDAAVYRLDQDFDIRIGMEVYDPDGQRIGSVREFAGFGSTQTPRAPDQEIAVVETQAKTGTGYIKVDQEAVLGPGATDLCVPFHGIQQITPEATLILNGAVISELGRQADRAEQTIADQGRARQGGWHRWRPSRKA